MGRKYEYATTTAKVDAGKAAQLLPNPPIGDGWEMCSSNVVPSTPRREYHEDEDDREFCKIVATIRVIWFWKREVSQ